MKKIQRNLAYYKNLLPKIITVLTKRTNDGLFAEVKEFPHCYTQADNIPELIEMVNDAVFTYLEIPVEYVRQLGIAYLPEKFSAELQGSRMQAAFDELMKENNPSPISIYRRLSMSEA